MAIVPNGSSTKWFLHPMDLSLNVSSAKQGSHQKAVLPTGSCVRYFFCQMATLLNNDHNKSLYCCQVSWYQFWSCTPPAPQKSIITAALTDILSCCSYPILLGSLYTFLPFFLQLLQGTDFLSFVFLFCMFFLLGYLARIRLLQFYLARISGDIRRSYIRLLCSQLCLEFACMLGCLLCLESARAVILLVCCTQFMHAQHADYLFLLSLPNQAGSLSHIFQLFLHAFRRVCILFY